jgi:hypothetical protein
MDSNLINQTAYDLNVVYKATMELYENYFQTLDAALKATPDSEIERLQKLNALVQEANDALQHDLAIFDKAISSDAEAIMSMQDELKIQSIYNKLN